MNYKLLIAQARKPEIYTESSVSLMTSAEEGQPHLMNWMNERTPTLLHLTHCSLKT